MGSIARKLVWVAGGLAILVCLAAAYGAYTLAGYSWDQVVSYESPYADYERRAVATPPAAAEATAGAAWGPPLPTTETSASAEATRVVLVICDGLTLEASRQMNVLGLLREHGTDMIATTPQPSLSYPTWTNILSGAPPDISGVTTNWFEGEVPVETLIDLALARQRRVAVSAPEDFVTLYGADRVGASYFDEWTDEYMTTTYVDEALSMADSYSPDFLLIHLPDADETAHDFGAASSEYDEVTQRMDGDITRLVQGLEDGRTIFVICADHGHIATGGHGGWEQEVTEVPAVFAGPGTRLGNGTMPQADIAPTVAALLDVPVPAQAAGRVNADVLVDVEDALRPAEIRHKKFARSYLEAIGAGTEELAGATSYDEIDAIVQAARDERLATDRASRLPEALVLAGAALCALVLLFLLSWRAGVAALAGAAAYNVFYNALYFLVHGYRWSLSAFNTEEYVQSFFYGRMVEAAVAAVVGVVVAALVYPLLRARPRGPGRGYLGAWLSLGPATILATLAIIAFQVAWFLWAWGAAVVWRLPDLKWGFKYDLDLTTATAVGAVALVAPLVSYLVGRYHPRVRTASSEETSTRGDS